MIDEKKLIRELEEAIGMFPAIYLGKKDEHNAYLDAITRALSLVKRQPKVGELYYFIYLDNGDAMGACYYSGMSHHKLRVKSGNCYRTREEAEKHSDEWMSKVYGKDWKELLK